MRAEVRAAVADLAREADALCLGFGQGKLRILTSLARPRSQSARQKKA